MTTSPIWFDRVSLERLNGLAANTLVAHLGIEIARLGDDFLDGSMPVDERTYRPGGLLHGGASVALAETLASIAGSLVVDPDRYYCVGIEANANHLRAVSGGRVSGRARPVHLGQSTQVWEVHIRDGKGRSICISRVTLMVLKGTGRHNPSDT